MIATSSNLELTTVTVGDLDSPYAHYVNLFYRPGTLDTLAMDEVLRRNTYGLPEQFNEHDCILDIGGHIGSFLAACYVRGARCIDTYEPDDENFQILLKNRKRLVGAADLGSIQIHAKAVFNDEQETVQFYKGMDPSMHLAFSEAPDGWEPGKQVFSVGLGQVLSKRERWRFVKIDAEGSEYEMLSSCMRDDLARIDELAIETHTRSGLTSTNLPCSHGDLVNLLEFFGFEITQDTPPPTENHNGMIHARRRVCPTVEAGTQAVTCAQGKKEAVQTATATDTRLKKLMIVRFPYGNQEAPSVTNWLVRTMLDLKQHPAIDKEILAIEFDDTPITMTRNKAVRVAQMNKVDYLLMVDSDMAPDMEGGRFLPESLDFLLKQDKPSIIAAPYGGPPPCCNVYVFQWANWMNDAANPDMRLEQFTREEVSQRTGIEEVAALPTGLILIDMRVFEKLNPPYFYYEWTDISESEKASTEDVTFTRDASLAGCPVYVNWNAWAGHWKRYLVPKPRTLNPEQVRKKFADAAARNIRPEEKRVEVGPTKLKSAGNGFANLN